MNSPAASANDFLIKLNAVVEVNFHNPQFGVSLLAKEMGMSRSSLHRKLIATLRLSASQYLSQFRLKKAIDLLRHTSSTVSEIAFKVGFNNVSYFIKCFHDFYGYPPGKVEKTKENYAESASSFQKRKKRTTTILASAVVVLLATVLYFIIFNPLNPGQHNPKKSIAVLLPYYNGNDSSDYLIDGIANALYSNLELIEDLNVTPWTSVLKYRNTNKDIAEIAKELRVKYIVELIGQNYGENNFGITVSLINADRNKTIPINRYKGTFNDIYTIEDEISKDVTKEIDANITPEESIRMEKVPTKNKTALMYYLQGLEQQNIDADSAISFFKKAVIEDNQFALAYAELANTFRLLNTGNSSNKYTQKILYYSDKAILYDNENDKCLITKARTLMNQNEYELAVNYLEKAVEYNPNSAISYRLLSYLNATWGIANPEKYVEFALKAVKYNKLEEDPQIKSQDYSNLARALRSSGFYEEAIKSIDKAIRITPEENEFYVEKSEIIIDRERNYERAMSLLKGRLAKYPDDYSLNLFLFKNYYHTGEYKKAIDYFDHFESDPNSKLQYRILSRLVYIYRQLGQEKEAKKCLEDLKESIQISKNKYLDIDDKVRFYCLNNDLSNAMKQIHILKEQECYFSYTIRLLEDEPIYENIRRLPEFQKILSEMQTKFNDDQKQIKKTLENKGLLPLTD